MNGLDITSYFRLSLPWGGRRQFTTEGLAIGIISIHALRGEGDKKVIYEKRLQFTFQSTPSVGRATIALRLAGSDKVYFNPRPPWGGRLACLASLAYNPDISIHALRGEGDNTRERPTRRTFLFQSTPSVRRATYGVLYRMLSVSNFNPRPPWGGRRFRFLFWWCFCCYFNPRPPWGGRLAMRFFT